MVLMLSKLPSNSVVKVPVRISSLLVFDKPVFDKEVPAIGRYSQGNSICGLLAINRVPSPSLQSPPPKSPRQGAEGPGEQNGWIRPVSQAGRDSMVPGRRLLRRLGKGLGRIVKYDHLESL